jgi:hypothetical protein
MKSMKISVAVLSVVALAAPGTSSFAKDKDKSKGKGKAHSEQPANPGTPDHHDGDGDGKVTLCHVPGGDRSKAHTITVGESAWSAHQGHGDYRGACRANAPGPGNGRFDALDRNDDGLISRGEWTGTEDQFDRLDRNDDGVISRREFGA